MGNYLSDRVFTDHIHQHLAIPKIYTPLLWKKVNLDVAESTYADMHEGVDHVFECKGLRHSVQERFREIRYRNFNDFTIRYRRDGNRHADRQQSEYYKMKAGYFTYGITNCPKEKIMQCDDFLKYALIDLKMVYSRIDTGEIVIRDNGASVCKKTIDHIECPVKYNKDGSSSFFAIDIAMLAERWGNEMIIAQKGFF